MTLSRNARRTLGASVAIVAVVTATVAVALAAAPHTSDIDAAMSPAATISAPSASPAEMEESVTPSPSTLASPPIAAPGSPSTPSPAPSATPSPDGSDEVEFVAPPALVDFEPITAGELEPSDAERLVAVALTSPSGAAAIDADELATLFADIAADSYASELEAQWAELAENGWSIEGEQRIDDLEVLSLAGSEATVAACIDASDVTVIDSSGEAIGADQARAPRAEHIFTLTHQDGIWRVTDRSFPDDPSC